MTDRLPRLTSLSRRTTTEPTVWTGQSPRKRTGPVDVALDELPGLIDGPALELRHLFSFHRSQVPELLVDAPVLPLRGLFLLASWHVVPASKQPLLGDVAL